MNEGIIRVVDLETTGFEPKDGAEVVELAFVDVDLKTKQVTPNRFSYMVKPERDIPPETSAIHHIIAEDVKDAPEWKIVAHTALNVCADKVVAFAAHNAKFEKLFCEEFTGDKPWLCTYKAALRKWPDSPSHSNQGIRYYRNPTGLDRDIADKAHRALPDAYVTAFHLRDLLWDGVTVEEMIEWSSLPALQVTCHIGKFRGMKWKDVDHGFLHWVIDKDFDEDVIFTAKSEIERRDKEMRGDSQEELSI